ncbi:MAG TPA: response regulator [Haliangiales bacterium]|nr:response regulator [Haliangiales bacterium]
MSDAAPPATVLIVDDDRGLLRLVEKSLRREGFTTATAASGREAINWLKERAADLMLLDLKLPDIEGKELIGQLAQIQRPVPFIVITGQGDERVAVDMMKRGALDYLVKDVQFQEFLPTMVRRAFGQLERERRLAAAEEELKREHAFISAVLDTSGALVVVLDREGRIVRFNRACEQTTGCSFEEVRGRRPWDLFIAPEELEQVKGMFAQLCSGRVPGLHENYWLTKSGERRLISWSNNVLRDAGERVEFVIGTGIDVTERQRLEKEILAVSSREQRRIGHDLHDGLSQQLAGIELMCEVLQQKLAAKSKAQAERAGEIACHVREAIAHTRSLARGLSPVQVEANGLMSALQELAANVEKMFKIECRFQCDEPILIRNNAAATHLYRIAQEAINNAIKHGKAKKILITFQPAADKHCLLVANDGADFPKDPDRSQGMGLRIMNYRAGEIGATLQIRGERARGTTVTCVFNKDL